MLVDEAYADFADGDCLSLLEQRPNVLITRTLSKGYGLAGLRFGYAIGESGGDRADGQGQRQLQLRRDGHCRRVRRARRSGVRARQLANHPRRARASRRRTRAPRASRSFRARATSCWRLRQTPRTPAGSTPRSSHAACWSGSSTRRRCTTNCGSASAPAKTMTRCWQRSTRRSSSLIERALAGVALSAVAAGSHRSPAAVLPTTSYAAPRSLRSPRSVGDGLTADPGAGSV